MAAPSRPLIPAENPRRRVDGGGFSELSGPGRFVFGLFLVFGLGSWVTINGIFVESSLLVTELPEKWQLATWVAAALQLSNLSALALLAPLLRWSRAPLAAVSASLLIVAALSASVLAASYRVTAVVGGTDHSLAVLALTFSCGLVSCASSFVFYPLVAPYPRLYTTALAVGEGLSGTFAGVLGVLQSRGRSGADGVAGLAFSPAAYFASTGVVCVASLGALALLAWHPGSQQVRSSTSTAALHPSEVEAVTSRPSSQGPSAVTNNGGGAAAVALGTTAKDPTHLEALGTSRGAVFREFAPVFTALFLGAGLSFGLLPSVNPVACLSYPGGQAVLLWSNAVVYGFDPVSRLLAAFVVMRRMVLLTSVFVAAAALIVVIAALSRSPGGPPLGGAGSAGGLLPVLLNLVFAATFGYAKTVAFLILKDAPGDRAEHLYKMAGYAIQAGSFAGSAISLFLVEVLKVFG